MNFYNYRTTRDYTRSWWVALGDCDTEAFYKRMFDVAALNCKKVDCWQMIAECIYEKTRRPYYNVYPSIVPLLSKLNMAVDTSLLRPPLPAFMVRFAENKPAFPFVQNGVQYGVRTMLVTASQLAGEKDGEHCDFDGITAWMDIGEREEQPPSSASASALAAASLPIYTFINIPLQNGMTLEDSANLLSLSSEWFHGVVFPQEAYINCIKLIGTLCLLDNDRSLIEPDVLDKDKDRLDDADDTLMQRLMDRAHRRGKVGWNIGRGIEVIPHYRRPRPALVWTGHGRTAPKIVMRKGTIVHRSAVEHVPTGFENQPNPNS